MSRFFLFLVAALFAAIAGWFFANEVAPPKFEDMSVATWVVVLVFSLALGGMASGGR